MAKEDTGAVAQSLHRAASNRSQVAGRLTASPDAGSAEAMDIAAALALLILDMPSPALFKRSDHDRTRLSSASNFS